MVLPYMLSFADVPLTTTCTGARVLMMNHLLGGLASKKSAPTTVSTALDSLRVNNVFSIQAIGNIARSVADEIIRQDIFSGIVPERTTLLSVAPRADTVVDGAQKNLFSMYGMSANVAKLVSGAKGNRVKIDRELSENVIAVLDICRSEDDLITLMERLKRIHLSALAAIIICADLREEPKCKIPSRGDDIPVYAVVVRSEIAKALRARCMLAS